MISRLGAKVRLLRQHAGWSQAELARRLGLSPRSKGYISEVEHGKKMPPAEKVLQIAQLFDVSTDYLLNDNLAPHTGRPGVR